MKAAIYGRELEANKSKYVQTLFDKMKSAGIEPIIFEPLYKYIKDEIKISQPISFFNTHDDLKGKVHFLFSIGGDGTLLETLSLIRDSEIPVMGINTGRLGFLSSISKEEIDFAIDAVMARKYMIDKRSLIRLETKTTLFGKVNYAMNDITIHKSDASSMISIHVWLDGQFLNTYYANGLIISTPTGSTAYSLSCGGPITMPSSENFIITPVAPHNLNVRPLIISDQSVLKIKVESRSDNPMVTLDSRSETIEGDIDLIIKKESFGINIVKLEDHDFLSTLRNKLNWGVDKRN